MLRPTETTVFDDINGGAAAKTDPVTLVFATINNLNLNAYSPKDKIIRDPSSANIWLQYPNECPSINRRFSDFQRDKKAIFRREYSELFRLG
jgi:hypothetical protein